MGMKTTEKCHNCFVYVSVNGLLILFLQFPRRNNSTRGTLTIIKNHHRFDIEELIKLRRTFVYFLLV